MAENASRFAGEKILIVDDEEIIVELSGLLLKKRGFDVYTAHNGEECMKLVAEQQPALVLLDYMMPVMNGLAALKAIRSRYSDTYVLMFTGKGSEEVAVQVMKAGAADYLQKPFANQNLLDRVDAVLAIRQVELENRRLMDERTFLQNEIRQWNAELEKRVREKSTELEQAQKEIIQSEKLATLGHIAAGLAHEIRNPLNSINLFAQILMTIEGLSDEDRGYVEKIGQEIERIDKILFQMLAASRTDTRKQLDVDLAATIEKVLKDNQTRIRTQQIDVRLALDPAAPPVSADPLEMEQILSNLIGNSLFEMPDGGLLDISLQRVQDKLVLKVKDSGQGIPAENLQRIFDPFYTTKKKRGRVSACRLSCALSRGAAVRSRSRVHPATVPVLLSNYP